MGRLERHLDHDLIARVENGWKPKDKVEPIKHVTLTRHWWTYRRAWRALQRENQEFDRFKKEPRRR